MNSLKNRVHLIGNLGMNPEVKSISNGSKLAKFSLATNETYKNVKGEKVTETQWHNLVAWGKTAEIAEKYLEKGKEIAVEGKIVSRQYDDKEGNKKYITEIVINDLLILSSKKS
jgi:single-strand DNA-binding protein